MSTATAYFRTSSAANVGEDKDSLRRQHEAVEEYAKRHGLDIVREYYDAAVSGGDPIDQRPGFSEMLGYLHSNGARTILVENASRFARDLAIQLTGHELLKRRGIELIPVDMPDHFTNETPTAVMVRQILGAVSQFEKASLVEKLRKARERKRVATGRCEGRPAVPEDVVALARKLRGVGRRKGKPAAYRKVAEGLAAAGHMAPSGRPYGPQSVKQMMG